VVLLLLLLQHLCRIALHWDRMKRELLPQHLDTVFALMAILIDALRHYGIGYRGELLLHLMKQVHNTNVGAMAARLGLATAGFLLLLWMRCVIQQLQLLIAPAAAGGTVGIRVWTGVGTLVLILFLPLKVLIDRLS